MIDWLKSEIERTEREEPFCATEWETLKRCLEKAEELKKEIKAVVCNDIGETNPVNLCKTQGGLEWICTNCKRVEKAFHSPQNEAQGAGIESVNAKVKPSADNNSQVEQGDKGVRNDSKLSDSPYDDLSEEEKK